MFDDGVEGERITPTGAAILKHLNPSFSARRAPSVLVGCGYGFGTKTFREFSNVLRMSVFDPQRSHSADNDIAVCQFEVDDQTPEDLAIGLERLRELPNVLDVLQLPVFSKKGRLATHVQVLGQLSQIDAIIECCFVETTTLGVRWHSVKRTTLERERRSYTLTDNDVRVKRAWRPDGRLTRKVEMADLAGASGGHAGREQLRREAHCRDIEDDGEPKLNPRSGQ